jgi:hypothetical protein
MAIFKKKKATKAKKVEAAVETVATEEVEVVVEKAAPKAKAVDLDSMSVKELYAHAKEKGIGIPRGLSRHEAIKVIRKKS